MSFAEEFGLTVDESLELKGVAENAMETEKALVSRLILEHASPETNERIREALVAGGFKAFSEAGQASLILLARDNPNEFQSLESVLKRVLVDPLMHRSIATWCFYFALQESSADFQLDHCPSPTEEGQLTGFLQGEISTKCEVWRKIAAGPLDRTETTLSLERIDLSILGGEQETGGDFGLVLDFNDKGTQPAIRNESVGTRIVPLILQAKRYVRPKADIYQKHVTRGYQYEMISQNQCASAYIFYENGTNRLDRPAPPMIKPVSNVSPPPYRTAVFEDSLDLPTYFLKALYDNSFAPGASSPTEALEMIYGSAHSGQLSSLAVISNSGKAEERYAIALADLREEIRNQHDTEDHEDPLSH